MANDREWGAPYFAQLKPKSNWVRFLSDFRNLNTQLKRKPYPIPKINEMWFKLEYFQYTTSTYLNMGYYHIQLKKNKSNLCMIILPRGKYCYKLIPTEIAYYPECFEQKTNYLFNKFEFICAYIDTLLILIEGDWTYCVQILESTLNKRKEKGLKCIIEKYFFGQTKMKCLGF